MKRLRLVLPLVLAAALPLHAGGRLDVSKRLDGPSPYPGYYLSETVFQFHDDRCVPVSYALDTSLDPLPNPLGEPPVSLAQARAVVEKAMASWNDVPTSYIELRIDDTTAGSAFFQTFDTVNEIHFRAPPFLRSAIAASPSITLAVDMELVAGTDVDGDGDADVAAGLVTCADTDGDGDREWPEGFYRAGTVLDNDVWFNTSGVRFTVDPAEVDTDTFSVDLEGIVAHELGHSVGLAHTAVNQVSPTDGTPATMYPFADPGDPDNELAMASLEWDDVSFASLAYPEGTAATGPAALQAGDVAFDDVFGRVTGEVIHGVLGHPVAGASVSAVDRHTGEVVASVYTGETVRYYEDPETFDIALLPGLESVVDGRWELAVPEGLYDLRIEPLDDRPVAGFRVSYAGWIGYLLGMLDFHEEGWNRDGEGPVETAPGRATPLRVNPGHTVSGVDFVTDRVQAIESFASWDWIVYPNAPPGTWYAVQIPGDRVLAAAGGERFAVRSADFYTYVLDNSALPLFAEAMLTTGRALPDGTAEIDLDRPLARESPFLGQEFDFSPLHFPDAVGLGQRIENGIASGEIDSLFLVLRVPTRGPFPGPNGFAPTIGIDGPWFGFNDGPLYGLSYVSFDGATFVQDAWNYMFRLNLTEMP